MGRIESREFPMKGGGTCVVRTPEEHEAAAVLECARDVFSTSQFTLTQADEFTYTIEEEAALIRQRTLDPHAIFLVACEGSAGGTMIGISNVWTGPKRKVRHVGTIGMSVHSAHRFRGIGKAMMRALVDWGESVPTLHMLDLAVYAANTPRDGSTNRSALFSTPTCPMAADTTTARCGIRSSCTANCTRTADRPRRPCPNYPKLNRRGARSSRSSADAWSALICAGSTSSRGHARTRRCSRALRSSRSTGTASNSRWKQLAGWFSFTSA
jgi:RimJ/RimL family protein N-acetyltransferase